MSDIKVGDLVMVVRAAMCCNSPKHIGRIYTVSGFYHGCKCQQCGQNAWTPSALINGKWSAFPLNELKRIDPLPESESVDEKDEVTA